MSNVPEILNNDSNEEFVSAQEEALFARGFDGQLVRAEKATIDDFETDVHLTIDGQPITVKKAVPQLNAFGEIARDENGRPIPRATTLYDAAMQLFVRKPGDTNPIPTLCHREHMRPVGVCRVCLVEIEIESKRGKRRAFVPSCVYRVADNMVIHTSKSEAEPPAAERVKNAVKVLVELLSADHLSEEQRDPTETNNTAERSNELLRLTRDYGVRYPRFDSRPAKETRGKDRSEMMFINHDACILCERCIRSCNDVKKNEVIGRTGKGYASRIGFDLDLPMQESSCVSCGECAISCPTDALVFRPEVVQRQVKLAQEAIDEAHSDRSGSGEVITATEMAEIPLFSGIPLKFLQFNGGASVRRRFKPGEVLCREGDYGATAFVILSGKFEVFLQSKRSSVQTKKATGLRGVLGGLTTFFASAENEPAANSGATTLRGGGRIFCTPEDLIIGEMTCLNRYPRSATVVAVEDSVVLEIRRNVLAMLQRNKSSREVLDRAYRKRALNSQLENMTLFEKLSAEQRQQVAGFLRERAELLRVDPGQTIFNQGEEGSDLYLVRLGFVKVAAKYGNSEQVLNYVGPGGFFGEIAALASIDPDPESPVETYRPKKRTASCSALDHVELVRIAGKHVAELLQQFAPLRDVLRQRARELLQADARRRQQIESLPGEFLEQGLFNAQSLLVLDLEACTRCDECTKACADTHDGVTRLVREGLRFDKFLVASSCRSCHDPYCLVGCPVDAIHRQGSMEIQIEDHCIGCGLCAENCPYGNINMHGIEEMRVIDGKKLPVVQQKATTCDLCRDAGGTPSCVYACPHNAAFRLTGKDLLAKIGSPAVQAAQR